MAASVGLLQRMFRVIRKVMLMTMPLDPALLLTTASRYSSNRRALWPPSLGR